MEVSDTHFQGAGFDICSQLTLQMRWCFEISDVGPTRHHQAPHIHAFRHQTGQRQAGAPPCCPPGKNRKRHFPRSFQYPQRPGGKLKNESWEWIQTRKCVKTTVSKRSCQIARVWNSRRGAARLHLPKFGVRYLVVSRHSETHLERFEHDFYHFCHHDTRP